MIDRRVLLACAAAFAAPSLSNGQAATRSLGDLPAAFREIEAAHGGRLGVSVLDMATGLRASYRGGERFPMASTFKALLAGAVLARVDAGAERLDRVIRFTRDDLVTWSPVTEPQAGGAGMTVQALCEATTAISDNTAANLLLESMGGPTGFTATLRRLGDGATRLDRRETALNEALPGDERDTSTPDAMRDTLAAMTLGTALSAPSRAHLTRWMFANRVGDARLRAGVPQGWRVADRTGTAAYRTSNVIGVMFPAGDRPPLVVTALLTEGPADGALRDRMLADVARRIAATVRDT